MLQFLLRCLVCSLLVTYSVSASAARGDAAKAKAEAKAKAKAKPKAATEAVDLDEEEAEAPEPKAKPEAEDEDGEGEGDEGEGEGDDEGDGEGGSPEAGANESQGIECSPAVSEVETRRAIPFSCAVTKKGVDKVEIRYKTPGRKKWTKLRLRKVGEDHQGEIPCLATGKRGALKLSIVGLGKGDQSLARISGVELHLVDATNEPPPAFPGREPPARCYDPTDCPNELKGSPACPGTKAVVGAKGWGAACGRTGDCTNGLACISGTCDTPPKCESGEDCSSGECSEGACVFPDPEDLSSRLGSPKFNWIGLHFAADMMLVSQGANVCGSRGDDASLYSCYVGGTRFGGSPAHNFAGTVASGSRLATMRALFSFDRWFGRLGAGARVGWAFGGSPKDFQPLHIEARVMYSMRADPMTKRFRPYLGLAGGLARVDAKSSVNVVNCLMGPTDTDCMNATSLQAFMAGNAEVKKLDAYREGKSVFFGPTIGFVYALANDSGIQLNLNVMFPEVVLQPSLGYVMGL